jgi:heme exporter protein D
MDFNLLDLHWGSWGEFFAMGGYAFYVWGSFASCALLLLWECLQAKSNWTSELNELGQAYELESDLAQFRGERT